MAMLSLNHAFHSPCWSPAICNSKVTSVLKGQSSRKATRLVASRALADEQSQSQLPSLPPEDLNYIVKLFCSCLGASFVIKYGSLLLPGLTRPNIFQALAMVLSPVAASMVTLSIASLKKRS